ncbi:acyl-CoA carboxylase subunit beta [Natronomonas halophila]|uniref:acyl-CoA carboxylase subunit beta n=1 Tax=Natronomonas halophila TaxID=2747817 RepID=UPI0015B48DB0|nr:acyl-CoA carboxylase subunit beta [Natronomonas halophila]QLD84487.1 acyl-CoA carboxylase subunit beta [Natronomonas halophila]
MEIKIDDETDEEIAQAIATAVSEHLGRGVELVDKGGGKLAEAGENWSEEGAVITEREEAIREDIEAIMSGGPERGFDKIDNLGKVFARDRLDMIFDEIEYEDGSFARYGDDDELPADGLITGIGTIDGRKVAFTANDYTVKAGSLGQMGVEKVIRIQERAMDLGIPMLRLVDSTGARLNAEEREPGDTHMDRYRGGKMFYNQCRMSGEIPQIGVLYGPDVAGSAYTPVFCDYLIMVEEISGMAIASPRIVEAMTGEQVDMQALGGPQVHAEESGSADLVVPDEETAAENAQEILKLLPQNYGEDPPEKTAKPPKKNPYSLDDIIPDEPNKAYDVTEVIDRVVDRDSFIEMKPDFAPELVTGLGRIDGQVVGIVANNPEHVSGAIFPDSADKGAGFVWTCDAYNIPLVYLCDTPGYMIGSQVEKEGVLRKGRKFIYATSNAQVPKFCVITRKAYGAGIYAMAGPSFGPDATLALPSAEISVMGPDAAVHALFGGQIEDMEGDAKDAFIESAKQEFDKYIDIKKQASKMQVDELIPAGDLREQLEVRLDTYRTKQRDDRPRHHGTVFF